MVEAIGIKNFTSKVSGMIERKYVTTTGYEVVYESNETTHRLIYSHWASDWTPIEFPIYLTNDAVSFMFKGERLYEMQELELSSESGAIAPKTPPRDATKLLVVQQLLKKVTGKELTYICDDKRHLICLPYTLVNLHRMAKELGIKQDWFHGDHYDIPKKRIEEITAKCEVVSTRRIIAILQAVGIRNKAKVRRAHN